jgi:AAA domain-containing protein/protein kinase-like protein
MATPAAEATEAPAKVTELVDRLFCSSSSARYGPYERVDNGLELIPQTLFRYRVLNRAERGLSLQVFTGLGAVGGHLWEQEARVLLRISSIQHPSLPEIVDGAYDDANDLAFVVTEATTDTLADRDALDYLHARRGECVRQLALLADALALLHGQGLMHRNVWPGAIDATLADSEMRLRLARFEMSALLSNMLRRAAADPLETEQAVRSLFLSQGTLPLAYFPPERLSLLLGGEHADTLETDRSDVFGLGAVAWEWFVGPLPFDPETAAEPGPDLKAQIEEAHGRMRAALARTNLPPPLQNLLRKMLDVDPRTRLTSAEVVDEIARRYDALIAGSQPPLSEAAPLVAFMPIESEKTIYRWGWIEHAPSTDEGRAELQDFIERDLRGGWLTYSPDGAEAYAEAGQRPAMREARYVLLGRQAAWFCVPYRRTSTFGALSEPVDDVLLIKYVAGVDRARSLQGRPFKRRLSVVDAVPFEVGADAAVEARRPGRPSWKPLLEAVGIESPRPSWEVTFDKAFEWLLELQQAELHASEYAFVRDDDGHDRRTARLRFDRARDDGRIHRSRSGLLSLIASDLRPSLGDYFDEPVTEEGVPALLQFRADSNGWPDRATNGVATRSTRLADDVIEVERSPASIAVPQEGWLRLQGDVGTEASLRRQREAATEFLEARGLLGQLHAPKTIKGLRHRWRNAGSDLRGGADQIVKDMLVSQPFFALHGPPGTGKTTVVAHAVEAFLNDEGSARVLVSAQSNNALDNLALRIIDRLSLESDDGDVLAIRVTSSGSDRNVHPRLVAWKLEEQAARLARRIRARCSQRVESRMDPEPVRAILSEWGASVHDSGLELQDRLRRGANLVFATCLGATRRNVDAVGGFGVYDWVIVEEAAKAWPTELAIPLVRGVRWTVVGDHRQLPAHRRDEVERILSRCAVAQDPELQRHGEARAEYAQVFDLFGSLFERERQTQPAGTALAEPLARLTTQFRMRPQIAEIISRAFYGGPGALATDPSADVPAAVHSPAALVDAAVVWIDTKGTDCSDEPAWANAGEAQLVRRLLEQFDPLPRVGNAHWSEHPLAVITPWRQQARMLSRELAVLDLADAVTTAHAFQGREADVVVASLVRDKRRGMAAKDNLGFFSRPELANVMLSRARRLLVIVGSLEHFNTSGVPFWHDVCETVREVGRIVPSAEI